MTIRKKHREKVIGETEEKLNSNLEVFRKV